MSLHFDKGTEAVRIKRSAGCYQHAGRPNRNGSYGDHVMAKRQLPPAHLVRQLLDCDPEKGTLTWKARPASMFDGGKRSDPLSRARIWNSKHAGKPAFTAERNGYLVGRLFYRTTMAHHVVWAFCYGEWPPSLDHINGDGKDNRIANLRAATPMVNSQNQSRRHDNKSGVTGVIWLPKFRRWQASIKVNYRNIYLGRYPSFEEAVIARKQGEERFGFHPNHGREKCRSATA